jgi:phasin
MRCTKNVALHKKMRYMNGIRNQDGFSKPLQKGREMARTAEKTAEFVGNVEFPTFDTTKATDQFRAFTEKGMEQSKEAYARMKAGAEDTQKAMESTLETAKTVSSDLSLKTISAFRDNVEASFAHLEALVGVKSVSELIELQTSFMRKRVEAGVEQARDFQSYASKAAEQVSAPMKSVFEKAVRELKVA